ncbi:hypothetical protein PAXINDRAFT_156773 [Paxillus involutus ATCC 200175]|uniref:Uncharacterized protein n=1 Tax=Paxillus involutus ATCC 200175 TaxID=664439 RepID=A0A0C9TB44_PAXIN|nr:hypothetical protein PAXINDRAFT_156773 [Paxillus involutus ATCC 200175]
MTRTPIELEPLKPASSLGVESRVLITSRNELWAFYLYYVGNSGLSGFNFGPSQFQNLLYLAGYDPSSQPPFQFHRPPHKWQSFAIQAVLLLVIGAWADYGSATPSHAKDTVTAAKVNIMVIFGLLMFGPPVITYQVGILEGMKAGDNTENNTRAFSALIAFSGAVWCAWFVAVLRFS